MVNFLPFNISKYSTSALLLRLLFSHLWLELLDPLRVPLFIPL